MNQAQLHIEKKMMSLSDVEFKASLTSLEESFQGADWDVEPDSLTSEKFRIEGTPLLFFWDGEKVHRITD